MSLQQRIFTRLEPWLHKLTLGALKTQSHIEAAIFILSQCGWYHA